MFRAGWCSQKIGEIMKHISHDRTLQTFYPFYRFPV